MCPPIRARGHLRPGDLRPVPLNDANVGSSDKVAGAFPTRKPRSITIGWDRTTDHLKGVEPLPADRKSNNLPLGGEECSDFRAFELLARNVHRDQEGLQQLDDLDAKLGAKDDRLGISFRISQSLLRGDVFILLTFSSMARNPLEREAARTINARDKSGEPTVPRIVRHRGLCKHT